MALKTERHHWWPGSLSEHWQDQEGMVSAMRPDGAITRAPGRNFGSITNAHRMMMGGPWDSTFEPSFNRPDNEMTNLVSWLLTLETNFIHSSEDMLRRIRAQELPVDRQAQLARCVASLAARSPCTRDALRREAEHYRKQYGLADWKADKTLIALNQRNLYDDYRARMESAGRWAVLFSDSREFICGDGMLHNLQPRGIVMGDGKCVVPLTPGISILFIYPGSYPSEPRLVTMRLDHDEVEFFNQTIQIYSKDFVFFRSQQPEVIDSFSDGTFYQYKYHKHEWLDELLHWLSQYCLWGPGGTPMCKPRERDAFDLDAFIERYDVKTG